MNREDTAVQRAVNDYQAAGFNKLLAIGQPAQTSGMQTAGGLRPDKDVLRRESGFI